MKKGTKHSQKILKLLSKLNKGKTPWNKGKVNKQLFICQICQKKFNAYGNRITCGQKCRAIIAAKKRKVNNWTHTEKFRKRISELLTGRKLSPETRKKLIGKIPWNKGTKGIMPSGEKSGVWSINPSYRALHLWVERQLGKPDTCNYCGKIGLSGRAIQWANISKQYLRIRSDWIRLCAKCHKAYDRKQS